MYPDTAACLAIAGAAIDCVSSLPNLGWELTIDRLEQQLQIPQLKLINDFAIIGYDIARLAEEDMKTLQAGKRQANAPQAVIGAGTGLGECFLRRAYGFRCSIGSGIYTARICL